jgi:3-oxoacyl-[acyl-carrier-protein] synthase I
MSAVDSKTTPLITPAAVTAYQCVSAAGVDVESLATALIANYSVLRPIELFELPFETLVGEVSASLPMPSVASRHYDCRNVRLALLALAQGNLRNVIESAVIRYGSARIGVVLGTSTSGIFDAENAYSDYVRHGVMPSSFRYQATQVAHVTGEALRLELGLTGPCYAISTACSSSAKALAAAQRLIAVGICDAVLVAGVDSLCRMTLRGFHSLQLLASGQCRPLDINRRGINIGEAAALLFLERPRPELSMYPRLLAVGESSDAYHMSAPHPEAEGAIHAMRSALHLAGRNASDVDYVNLHATGTLLNDQADVSAIRRLFAESAALPPCSGVKGLLGHTLGAAGAVEAIVCLLAMERGFLPGTCGLVQLDPDCDCHVVTVPQPALPRLVMSNNFGFGGNNASVLMERGSCER